jgi:hypothetical protein
MVGKMEADILGIVAIRAASTRRCVDSKDGPTVVNVLDQKKEDPA